MAEGILCYMGLEMAKLGVSAAEIARVLTDRATDLRMYVSLETLEYLKKGGRISGAQAAIGTLLSVKPIIAVEARRRRDRRQAADAVEVARALHRADLRPADRAALDPAHDGPRRRRVQGRGRSGGRGSIRPTSMTSDRRARRSGRISVPAASARRCSTSAEEAGPDGLRRSVRNGCGTVAATLRYGRSAEDRTSRRGGYTPVAFISTRTPRPRSPDGAPWGRPGDDPQSRRPAAMRGCERPRRSRSCTMTTEQVAAVDQSLAGRPAAVRPGRRAAQPRPRPAPRPPRAAPRADRPLPREDGRRVGPGLHGLPRPAQPRPRPGQGRHPLPPGRSASTRSRPSRCG